MFGLKLRAEDMSSEILRELMLLGIYKIIFEAYSPDIINFHVLCCRLELRNMMAAKIVAKRNWFSLILNTSMYK